MDRKQVLLNVGGMGVVGCLVLLMLVSDLRFALLSVIARQGVQTHSGLTDIEADRGGEAITHLYIRTQCGCGKCIYIYLPIKYILFT